MAVLHKNQTRLLIKKIALSAVLAVLAAWLLAILPQPVIGDTDLRAYWGAGYLLGEGEPFTDYELMQDVQRELTGWPLETGR